MEDGRGGGPGAGGRLRLRAGNRIVQAGRAGRRVVGFRNGNHEECREGHGSSVVGTAGVSYRTGLEYLITR